MDHYYTSFWIFEIYVKYAWLSLLPPFIDSHIWAISKPRIDNKYTTKCDSTFKTFVQCRIIMQSEAATKPMNHVSLFVHGFRWSYSYIITLNIRWSNIELIGHHVDITSNHSTINTTLEAKIYLWISTITLVTIYYCTLRYHFVNEILSNRSKKNNHKKISIHTLWINPVLCFK